jgi:hypothetical protein
MPAMLADSMEAMTPIMQKYMEKVQGRIQEQTTAMLKQAENKSGPATKN